MFILDLYRSQKSNYLKAIKTINEHNLDLDAGSDWFESFKIQNPCFNVSNSYNIFYEIVIDYLLDNPVKILKDAMSYRKRKLPEMRKKVIHELKSEIKKL